MDDKTLVEGKSGSVKLTLKDGKCRVEGSASLGSIGASAGGFIEEDSGVLIDLLFAEIESKSPAGAVVIEESVKAMIKAAVQKI